MIAGNSHTSRQERDDVREDINLPGNRRHWEAPSLSRPSNSVQNHCYGKFKYEKIHLGATAIMDSCFPVAPKLIICTSGRDWWIFHHWIIYYSLVNWHNPLRLRWQVEEKDPEFSDHSSCMVCKWSLTILHTSVRCTELPTSILVFMLFLLLDEPLITLFLIF